MPLKFHDSRRHPGVGNGTSQMNVSKADSIMRSAKTLPFVLSSLAFALLAACGGKSGAGGSGGAPDTGAGTGGQAPVGSGGTTATTGTGGVTGTGGAATAS